MSHQETSDRVGCNPATVTKWRRRFAEQRPDGMIDGTRRWCAHDRGQFCTFTTGLAVVVLPAIALSTDWAIALAGPLGEWTYQPIPDHGQRKLTLKSRGDDRNNSSRLHP